MKYLMFVAVDPDHTAEDAARAPDIFHRWAKVRLGPGSAAAVA